ncbi:MAG: class I SAM-dependent methyltransferase [Elusimicrobia bacterium]|nr:class I SAM-dependent methyltransferase [Elusimicrobiota bacterium]
MTNSPVKLYLELMKKVLSFSMWPDPPVSVETFSASRPLFKRAAVSFVSRILALKQMGLFYTDQPSREDRYEGKVWPNWADTMIGIPRLNNIQECVEAIIKENVEGDLIETGVWRGGACVFMRAILAAYGVEGRRVFVADSFQGLPEPDEKYPADSASKYHTFPRLAISLDEVRNNFQKYDLLDDKVIFLPGWFKDTLTTPSIGKLAVMRLDGDIYSSTIEALNSLYPKLSPGGFCIIDDYALSGCRKAVDDYRAEHNIADHIHKIDWTGCFWRKAKK